MKIEIKTKSNASSRTKNRIRERGPAFTFKRDREFEGIPGIQVESLDRKWSGWLPSFEIEVTEVEQSEL